MRRLPSEAREHRGTKTDDAEKPETLQPKGCGVICVGVAVDEIRGGLDCGGPALSRIQGDATRCRCEHDRSRGPVHESTDAVGLHQCATTDLDRFQFTGPDQFIDYRMARPNHPDVEYDAGI